MHVTESTSKQHYMHEYVRDYEHIYGIRYQIISQMAGVKSQMNYSKNLQVVNWISMHDSLLHQGNEQLLSILRPRNLNGMSIHEQEKNGSLQSLFIIHHYITCSKLLQYSHCTLNGPLDMTKVCIKSEIKNCGIIFNGTYCKCTHSEGKDA